MEPSPKIFICVTETIFNWYEGEVLSKRIRPKYPLLVSMCYVYDAKKKWRIVVLLWDFEGYLLCLVTNYHQYVVDLCCF